MNPTVQVLLATYNGERYLHAQIESILAQTYEPLLILARDDGSTDLTCAILESYAAHLPERFAILAHDAPTGSAKCNFMRLIEAAVGAQAAQYFACADQDDVWLPEKVARSMEAMHGLELKHSDAVPLLVFTDLAVVDDGLYPLHASLWEHQNIVPANIHRFARLLTQNVVTGCTMLFNRSLAELANPLPADAFMHDWWMALAASAMGAADYVREPTVLYRQHSANVVGALHLPPPTGIPRWRYHRERRAQWEMSEKQAAAFLELQGARLEPRYKRLLRAYVRSETHPNRLVRTVNLVLHGFFLKGVRPNLAILWYLWDMKAAKRAEAAVRFEDLKRR